MTSPSDEGIPPEGQGAGNFPEEPKTMDLPDQMKFGVSIFEMTGGEPVMHIHRGPGVEDVSVGELWRMMAQAKLNMELEMQSGKFMQALDSMRQAKPRIITP